MEAGGGGSRAALKRARKKARDAPAGEPVPQRPRTEPAAASSTPAQAAPAQREWTEVMPQSDSDLGEALQVARAQAATITGRKYRYGAVLLADDIVLRASSNKTPFQRDPIHAEMAAIKGCPRPEGKDVVLVRLAPVKPRGDEGEGEEDEGDEDDDGPSGSLVPKPVVAAGPCKVLNAKPCAACEAKMTARGIRRVFYTINARELGVMQLNPTCGVKTSSR